MGHVAAGRFEAPCMPDSFSPGRSARGAPPASAAFASGIVLFSGNQALWVCSASSSHGKK
jgi:hypothetical protein